MKIVYSFILKANLITLNTKLRLKFKMYQYLFKPLLFKLPPELSHTLSLKGLAAANALNLIKYLHSQPYRERTLMGLKFTNPVGLAAGLDKNGDYIDALASLGFGFIEIGTVTPKAQSGNPKPRLFRIPKEQALINRMGFNNQGIDYLLQRVQKARYRGILGINIGKNASTPIEEAVQDYLICLQAAYSYASYITVNISSPNTRGLRTLQHGSFLEELLTALKHEQQVLAAQYQKQVPLVVKIAPDLDQAEIIELADTLRRFAVDGIIATNTTLSRSGMSACPKSQETGGLSGLPLAAQSTEVLRILRQELQGKIPLIASGGIMNAEIAQQKFDAGADLIQLYTGLIYQGPQLIKACLARAGIPLPQNKL